MRWEINENQKQVVGICLLFLGKSTKVTNFYPDWLRKKVKY